MEKEMWKPVKNFECLYEISNYGRVKSLKQEKEKILKLWTEKSGYVWKFD